VQSDVIENPVLDLKELKVPGSDAYDRFGRKNPDCAPRYGTGIFFSGANRKELC
jgi:hypothetical protein